MPEMQNNHELFPKFSITKSAKENKMWSEAIKIYQNIQWPKTLWKGFYLYFWFPVAWVKHNDSLPSSTMIISHLTCKKITVFDINVLHANTDLKSYFPWLLVKVADKQEGYFTGVCEKCAARIYGVVC